MEFLRILREQAAYILPYWAVGILVGSAVSVFCKERIHALFVRMQGGRWGVAGLLFASALGVASPLCMYGTIPIAASFSRQGVKDDWLAAFMMSSVLINPQLLVYTAALGKEVLLIRLAVCLGCGMAAGLCVRLGFCGRDFFCFRGFDVRGGQRERENMCLRYVFSVGRNIRATGPWFLAGVALASLCLYAVPATCLNDSFAGDAVLQVLWMTLMGIPFYVCGGGAVPMMASWLNLGMSLGAVMAFSVSGAATKITNMGALKIVLGGRHFALYLAFVVVFSVVSGWVVNVFYS